MSSLELSSFAAAALVVAAAAAAAPALAEQPGQGARGAQGSAIQSIVLVHGAFADGSSWDKVVPGLQAKGYHVVAVHQPLTSLADDVAATRRAIELVPGPVLLVGHSYGGAVITEAGAHDKVAGLVYIAAFALDANESPAEALKGHASPSWIQGMKIDDGGFGWLPEDLVLSDFVPDLPKAQAKVVAAKQGPINAQAFEAKVSDAAWKSKPAWYLRTANDKIVPPDAQAAMAKDIQATTRTIQSDHVPMLSKPKEVTSLILTAASKAPGEAPQRAAQLEQGRGGASGTMAPERH